MSIAIAKNHMAEMKMLGMLAVLDKTLTEATRDKISYTEFADILLQAEADYRQERKTVNRIKAAKFTVRPALEDFDFTAKRSITKAEIKEIYTLGWLNDARPLVLIGQTGVGKTFIAQAIGLHACASGKSVLYMSITAFLDNLAIARSGAALFGRREAAMPDAGVGRGCTRQSVRECPAWREDFSAARPDKAFVYYLTSLQFVLQSVIPERAAVTLWTTSFPFLCVFPRPWRPASKQLPSAWA
jgi:hypothetical protein